MRLSIITINYNNAEGLRKTLTSVSSQTYRDIEHVIVDGGSTDGSVDVIKDYVSKVERVNDERMKVIWSSEPDKGIYNAMNKGICKASGEYIQILNSGDLLFDKDVVAKMLNALKEKNYPEILYGNMIKQWPDGKRLNNNGYPDALSMLSFYFGTLNHDSAYIRRDLFDRFGLYDESLKIVSDWKWFLKAIPLGGINPVYVDIDVTIFDMTGVSESNTDKWKVERRPVLEELVPSMILADYDQYGEDMWMIKRLRKHHMRGLVRFIERVLFKLEKWHILKG